MIVKTRANHFKRGSTDFARLKKLTDKEIESAVASDPDAAPLDIDWSNAKVVIPKN